jgi:hypothetical protein
MSVKLLPTTQCFCYGAVTCCPKFISSLNVWFRGQDAALEAHHSRNTHVVANWVGPVDSDEQADKISVDKNKNAKRPLTTKN